MEQDLAVAFLRNISERMVNDKDKSLLKQATESIARESVSGRKNDNAFLEYINTFNENVAFEKYLPSKTHLELLELFKEMWKNKDLARFIMESVYSINIDAHSQAPREIQSQEFYDDFLKILEQGSENVQNIRLMVVGMFQAGKTSLVNNLIDDYRSKPNRNIESTHGIEVHKCQILKGKWELNSPTLEERIQGIIGKREAKKKTVNKTMNQSKGMFIEVPFVVDRQQTHQTSEQNFEDKTAIVEERRDQILNASSKAGLAMSLLEKFDFKPEKHGVETYLKKSEPKTYPPAVSVWDFAGQNIYYTTHHFFLNKRSIYILLMDISRDLDDEITDCRFIRNVQGRFTCRDAFKFWLNSIHMYTSWHTEDKKDIKATVILVGTHKDKLENMTEEEKEQRKDEFFDDALTPFENSDAILAHVHDKKFLVNNMDQESPVFEEIKRTVEKIASEQYYWNEKVPARWIELEKRLEENTTDLITFQTVKETGQKMTFKITNEKQLRMFLKTHHELGNLLYFETAKLRDVVVLNPSWAIDAFKLFINHVPNKNARNTKDWNLFRTLAILRPNLIKEILEKADERLRPYEEEIIGFMEKLYIIAKPVPLEEVACGPGPINGYCPHSARYLDIFIVPCLLKKLPDENLLQSWMSKNETAAETPVLCFEFKDQFMPPGVFHRLQASCIRTWQVARNSDELYLYNGLGIFHFKEKYHLQIWYVDHRIYCRISVIANENTKDLANEAGEIREVLDKALQHILPPFGKCRPYEEYVQCECTSEPGKCLFRVRDFLYKDRRLCEEGLRSHQIHKSYVLDTWFQEIKADNSHAESEVEPNVTNMNT